MSTPLQIICPNCGTSQKVPSDKVPEEGAWGTCAVCRHRIFVERQSAAQSAEEQPALSDDTWAPPEPTLQPDKETRAPSTTPLYLKTPNGETVHLPVKEIEKGIRLREILPWDLVSSDGQRFGQIQKYPEFDELFPEAPLAVQRQCWNHPEKVAEKLCARCQRCYCAECVPPPTREGTSARSCWACGGVLQDTDPGWRKKPYWKRLREVLLFPRGNVGWLATGGLGLLLWLASLSMLTAPLYLVGLVFLVYVLSSSAKGRETLQEILRSKPETADIQEVAERSLLALAVIAVMAAPFLIVNAILPLSLASALGFFLGLAVFAYHPMALGMGVFSEKPLDAFLPKAVLWQIYVMADDYLTLLLGLLAMDFLLFATQVVIGSIPLLGGLLAKVVLAYGLIVEAHMIGWTFWLNLGRLGWRRILVV
jgi:hypothetical protein